MKRMKIVLMAVVTIIMGTTFTSCLDSDNGGNYADGIAYASVEEFYQSLSVDGGLTFRPTNFSILKYTDGSYPNRVNFTYQLAEGETITEGKTTYQVTILRAVGLPDREFCRVDTLGDVSGVRPGKGSPIQQFDSYLPLWEGNGYLNVSFGVTGTSATTANHFDMYADDVKDGVLYMKLHFNQKTVTSGQNYGVTMCYYAFGRSELSEQLGEKFAKLDIKNDSVKVVVVADSDSNGGTIKTKEVKARLR